MTTAATPKLDGHTSFVRPGDSHTPSSDKGSWTDYCDWTWWNRWRLARGIVTTTLTACVTVTNANQLIRYAVGGQQHMG